MVVAELQVVVTTHHALARDVLQKKEHQCSKTTLTQLFNMGGIENLFIRTKSYMRFYIRFPQRLHTREEPTEIGLFHDWSVVKSVSAEM